jgi:hypothetical protein
LLERQDFRHYLDNQYDPQEMVDAIARTIPAERHPCRTVCPELSLKQDKDFEPQVWAAMV